MSEPRSLPLTDDVVVGEVTLRGHRPTYERRVQLTSGSRADRWTCAGDDCEAKLVLFANGRYAGDMLRRACGPYRRVNRSTS